MHEAEPSGITKWAGRAITVLVLAAGANTLLDLHWLAPWDVDGKAGLVAAAGIAFAWSAWQKKKRNERPADPERAYLGSQWSAPGGRRAKWRVALWSVGLMAIVVLATLYKDGPSDDAWVDVSVWVILAIILAFVLYRQQFRRADEVVENGTGLSVFGRNREVQVAWNQIADIAHEIDHGVVTVRIDLKEAAPPFGTVIRFMPAKPIGQNDTEQAMLLAEMRRRAGLDRRTSGTSPL